VSPSENANSNPIHSLLASLLGITSLSERNTIAVVDDDPEIRDGLELLLSSYGYRTLLFASAKEFLSAAATAVAACLVVDVQLGDSSGIELGRNLSTMGCATPIIFITASQEELHRRQAMALGCVAFLLKPFSADRLIEAIKRAVGSKLH
jgi:FixJ family two-component response regulator